MITKAFYSPKINPNVFNYVIKGKLHQDTTVRRNNEVIAKFHFD